MTDLIIFLVLLATGYTVGRIAERRHYRSILAREKEMANVMVFTNRFPPLTQQASQALVTGSVVISEDYFKRVVSGLQSLLGGRLRAYESLLDRARREAVLRMKQEARDKGARMIINVKFQTFSIPGRNPKSFGAVEVMAYGTALTPR
ncbi:MAG TPA: heavy metal-binding domain-containing protein [Burkholderiales bacterium]|nr:heavy metal-binding domain-containing protein [Burkholderiales bacterium]